LRFYAGGHAREQLGYAALWVNGGQLASLDRLTELLSATDSVVVAPAVVVPDVFDAGAVGQYVVVDTDRAAARESARAPMRMLFSLPSYIRSARRQGFDTSDIESLSDRLVDAFVAWG
jgi:hypothetical protein